MGKSFDDWFKGVEPEPEPKAPEPEKFYDYDAELPHDVDFGDKPGTYIYRCRGCENWKPMEWELSEDHPDSHYCGGSPYCCPLKPTDTWLRHKKVVTQVQPKKAKPVPPPAAQPRDVAKCQACGCQYLRKDMRRGSDGGLYCRSYGCVPQGYAQPNCNPQLEPKTPKHHPGMPTAGQAREAYNQLQQTFVCPGCNMRIPRDCAHGHPDTRQPYCGDAYCQERMRGNVPPPPPRAG